MLWFSLAHAATLPTGCPATVTTGEDVADYRADVVVPAVVSVTSRLYTLRDDYGDAGCPASDGSACTAGSGVEFEGALETTLSGTRAYDSSCFADTGSLLYGATASALAADGLDGATLSADGTATYDRDMWCGYETDWTYDWTGPLSVTGAWEDLADDDVDADVTDQIEWFGGDVIETSEWSGRSGDCDWSATSSEDWSGAVWLEQGEVTISGVTVTWEWSTRPTYDRLCYGYTAIDGVWVGGPEWAAEDDGWAVAEWIDDDQDGWQAACDCDDADPGVSVGATEIPGNASDEDCDGLAQDVDGDGYDTDDCDDADPTIHPGVEDPCGDGIDWDCDGRDDYDCDGDGWGGAQDCDDTDAHIRPGGWDPCGDGIDQDCADGDEPCPDTGDTDPPPGDSVATDTGSPPADEPKADDEAPAGCGRGCAGLLLLLPASRIRRRREAGGRG